MKPIQLMKPHGLIAAAFAIAAAHALGVGADRPAPPMYSGPPRAEYATTQRAFQGIPSLAVTPRGRLWATWYAGVTPGEDHNNYVVLSTSGDQGKTWKEVLVADPDGSGPARAFDPEIWLGPDGKLRWYWASRISDVKTDRLWMRETAEIESENAAWAPPAHVANGVMMCKPIVLSTGEWVLPVCTWFSEQSSKMVVSSDAGKTWSIRGGCTVPPAARTFDEHMFIERTNGDIWLLARTKYGIGESVSKDRGATWPDLAPSGIPHPSARFFVRRLASGNLLLVKHGPLDRQTGRSHLMAFVSRDDGRRWQGGLLLDERSGVSYPDGQQDSDGLIRIIYDFSRTGDRQILIASFREEDAAAGKEITGAVRLRQLVSQGSGGRQAPRPAPDANADGAPLRTRPRGAIEGAGAQPRPFAAGEKLFQDRQYTLAECPEPLASAAFLPIPMDGKKELRCRRAGLVYFLTPAPARNKDSAAHTLVSQGFRKVRQPEVRLFDPANPANFCTLYQKECAEGETIAVGKWAVPLFFP